MRLFTLVLGFFHCFQKFFPVFSQPGQCLFHRHPINSRRSLVGFDPLAGSVQVLPAQDPFKQIRTALFLSFLTANTLRSRIPFVFRTISLWAARLFAVFPFIMLTSFCNLLGTNDCSVIPSFFPVLWPLLTSCGSLLLRIFSPMRPQDLPGYSHVLFLFTCRIYRKAIPCSDWALFCYANLPSPPALYAISVRQTRALPIRGTFSPYSGFLQIPPHDGHPCLWLTLPTTGRIRDFHPIECALTGRTRRLRVLSEERARSRENKINISKDNQSTAPKSGGWPPDWCGI